MATIPDIASVEAYIRQSAAARGIDPEIAVRVARSEGLAPGVWQSNVMRNGVREPSYGPFQLLVGGQNGMPTGLGNTFMQQTGLDPRDPSTYRQQIDFALDHAKKGGWSPWYGAAKVGVGSRQGIGGIPLNPTADEVNNPANPMGRPITGHPIQPGMYSGSNPAGTAPTVNDEPQRPDFQRIAQVNTPQLPEPAKPMPLNAAPQPMTLADKLTSPDMVADVFSDPELRKELESTVGQRRARGLEQYAAIGGITGRMGATREAKQIAEAGERGASGMGIMVNKGVLQRVAKLLASGDPNDIQKLKTLATNNKNFAIALQAIQRGYA